MLDIAFNLSNDPVFYIVTLTLLVNLSGITAWAFLSEHHGLSFVQNTKWVYGKFSVQTVGQGDLVTAGRLIQWISKIVRRKEGPQDDSDDHVFFFVFSV